MRLKRIFLIITSIVIVAIFLIGLFLFFSVIDAKKRGKQLMINPTTTIHNEPKDYMHLFKVDDKLNLIETTYSKHRNPISELNYSKKYYLEIYEIGVTDKKKLNEILTE